MKTVEYWRYMTWNLQRTKMTPTRFHMDEETALARYPEAVRVPNSMELRQICETEADMSLQMIKLPVGPLKQPDHGYSSSPIGFETIGTAGYPLQAENLLGPEDHMALRN